MSLPTDAKSRKAVPIATGVLDYFPDAIAAVAELSRIGNEQHNPGEPLHWAREKSTDHADCIVRHLMERGTTDTDGVLHAVKVAWRALALAQTEIEKSRAQYEELRVTGKLPRDDSPRIIGRHPAIGAGYGAQHSQLSDVPPSLDDPLRRVPGRQLPPNFGSPF